MAAAVVLAMLAALPALAGSGLIKITHASAAPYECKVQDMSSIAAKAQPKASLATPSEVQVAVMASSPSKPAAKASVFIRR
jgi:hypothetical protein